MKSKKTIQEMWGCAVLAKMLQLWLERQPDATWEQLIQALKEVKMNELASTIVQELSSVSKGKLFVTAPD